MVLHINLTFELTFWIDEKQTEIVLRNPQNLKSTDFVEDFNNCFPFSFLVCHLLVAQANFFTYCSRLDAYRRVTICVRMKAIL